MSNPTFPIVVYHNVLSPKGCTDFVKIASGMGFKTLIITHAQGSAAQRGLPAAQKLALKNNVNFMSLLDIDDVKELFQPELVLVIAPVPYGEKNLTEEFLKTIEDKRYVVVFGGNDPGLSRKDLEKGDEIIQIPVGDLGSIGILTLGLALFTRKFKFNK
ncbi:MAG: RecB-family nuclease [Candidatus Kariarchaeaceae archaeon]